MVPKFAFLVFTQKVGATVSMHEKLCAEVVSSLSSSRKQTLWGGEDCAAFAQEVFEILDISGKGFLSQSEFLGSEFCNGCACFMNF